MNGLPLRIALLGPANSIHLRRWAIALAGRGHAVCVLSQHPCDDALLPAAVERVWLPWRGGAGYLANAWALRQHLRRWRAGLLNVHYASGYGTTAGLSGVPLPSLLSVWGSDVYEFPHRGPLQGALARWNLRRATALASTSQAMAGQVRRLTPERRDVAITPFGVDVSLFTPASAPAQSRHPAGRLTIGLLKSLAPAYGVDLLLRAFAGLVNDPGLVSQPCELLIVGEGPQRAELEALAGRLGIGTRTRFVGAVPHAEVPAWLHRFDIYAAPSRSESFGVAVIEASACGLPVVVSDAGGLPEVVQDGETGCIVPCQDVPALQAALKRLLLDAGLRDRLGRQGRDFVARNYGWEACVDRMETCYRQLLSDDAARKTHNA